MMFPKNQHKVAGFTHVSPKYDPIEILSSEMS